MYFMNETLNWSDVRLFLAIARADGLSGATAQTKTSAPTLSRRMVSLEQTLGVSLFVRRQNGYELTAAGVEFLVHAESMEEAAIGMERWRTASDPNQLVTIATGPWTSMFIARHVGVLLDGDAGLSIQIQTGASAANLIRREANLGLRNSRPQTQGLAGRRLVRVNFALYGHESLGQRCSGISVDTGSQLPGDFDWIAFTPSGPKTPSAVWLEDNLRHDARVRCSSTQAVLEACRSGAGLCVLPCFIGDLQTDFRRVSEPIRQLAHDQWLVSHDEDRHNAHIKRVSEKLATLVRSQRQLFSGHPEV